MTTEFLAGIALTWFLCGFVSAFVMRRRGHNFLVWLGLGTVLGPLIVPLVVDRLRHDTDPDSQRSVNVRTGSLDVLVGVDGSSESLEALRSMNAMLGKEVSSVTLATVLDFDARDAQDAAEMRDGAVEMLEGAARAASMGDSNIEVLYGPPGRALSSFAEENGFELVVVGARGKGATERLFGSVTTNLVGSSKVPVMIGKPPIPAALPQMHPD